MAEAAQPGPPTEVATANRAQWAKVKTKAGTKPYKHKVYDAFYPVLPAHVQGGAAGEEEATHAKKPGRMVNSYMSVHRQRVRSVHRRESPCRAIHKGQGEVHI